MMSCHSTRPNAPDTSNPKVALILVMVAACSIDTRVEPEPPPQAQLETYDAVESCPNVAGHPHDGCVPPTSAESPATAQAASAPSTQPQSTETGPTPRSDTSRRIRKSVRELSAEERADFIAAVLALKAAPSPYGDSVSWYDKFVEWHVDLFRCHPGEPMESMQMGHGSPLFLPWHREYLLLFEDALRAVSGKDITVPFWDWSDREETVMVFADDFMGGSGNPLRNYAVTSGPFREGEWVLSVVNQGARYGAQATPFLKRSFSLDTVELLPSVADTKALLDIPRYDVAPFHDGSEPSLSFRSAIEGANTIGGISNMSCAEDGWISTAILGIPQFHSAVHAWTGGAAIAVSPPLKLVLGDMAFGQAATNDPVFWLLHANVDRIWAAWQAIHAVDSYEPKNTDGPNGFDTPLETFAADGIMATPRDVSDIAKLGYAYSRGL